MLSAVTHTPHVCALKVYRGRGATAGNLRWTAAGYDNTPETVFAVL